MKLSCCMIVRDEASTLQRCLETVRPYVDELCIVDTGSADDTPRIAREFADKFEVWTGCNDAEGRIEDFAAARNRSFDLATGSWLFWIDGDDELVGGEHLRRLCKEADSQEQAQYLARYEYAHDAQGKCTVMQVRERLLKGPVRWKTPVHEVCQHTSGPVPAMFTEEFRVIHRSQVSKKPREVGRNLRILEAYVKKAGEGDVRALFYLGVEYAMFGRLGESNRVLRRYVALTGWADEKCLALIQLAKNYDTLSDHEMAIEWAMKALLVKAWIEPYYLLAKNFYQLAERGQDTELNYRRAAHFAQTGLNNTNENTVLFVDPTLKFRIHEYLSPALGRIGDVKGALMSAEAGLVGMPDSELYLNNRKVAHQLLVRQQIVELSEQLDQPEVVKELIRQAANGEIPVGGKPAESTPAVNSLPPCTVPARDMAPGKLDIVLWTGPAYEHWNPTFLEANGMGGSETMAWEIARRLAKQGHRVRHYGNCTAEQEGLFDGVEWYHWERAIDVECEILIASRQPEAIDRVRAKCSLLWVHDVHSGPALTRERVLRFDRILCLSNWHKEFFVEFYRERGIIIDPERVLVMRNAVDVTRFQGAGIERKPHRAIYSSSPDRGLELLIDEWPKVRSRVPDAELHVFYGFNSWAYGDEERERLLKRMRETAGVVYRGRVNQRELAQEFLAAGVWAYPTWFTETSCITAMEAQVAGCYVLHSGVAALSETVLHGYRVEAEYGSVEFRERVVNAVAMLMLARGFTTTTERATETFSLETRALEWQELLYETMHAVKRDVVPRFYEGVFP